MYDDYYEDTGNGVSDKERQGAFIGLTCGFILMITLLYLKFNL